jgi:hypothetical protein
MKTLSIIPNPFRKNDVALCIVYNDGTKDTISLKKQASPSTRLSNVLRTEIQHQIDEFYLASIPECCRCKATRFIEVDHTGDFEFRKIVEMFMKGRPMPEFEKRANHHWYLTDRALADEWRSFHLENARFQLLCKTCHSKKSL